MRWRRGSGLFWIRLLCHARKSMVLSILTRLTPPVQFANGAAVDRAKVRGFGRLDLWRFGLLIRFPALVRRVPLWPGP